MGVHGHMDASHRRPLWDQCTIIFDDIAPVRSESAVSPSGTLVIMLDRGLSGPDVVQALGEIARRHPDSLVPRIERVRDVG